jgi:hypothetical protein
MKFALKVDQTKYTPTGITTADNTELLGWVKTSSALDAAMISSSYFYQSSWVGTTIDSASFVRNDADEYVYTYNKSDTEAKWENISDKTQYFYAVNRAGLICPNPIIIEFVENPVPSITSRTFEDVEEFENEGKIPPILSTLVTMGSDMRLYFKKIPDKTPSTGGFVFDDIMYSFIETNEG